MDALRDAVAEDRRIDYALMFGSRARGTAHTGSDLDIAFGLEPHARIGALENRLFATTARPARS